MRGQLRKARRAIIFFFTGTGCIYGLLTARLPALQAQLQVGEALIGMAMLCLGCGSLAGFAVMHFLQRHCGAHHMLRLASFCLMLSLPLCGLAWSGSAFCAACAVMGFCFALSDVTVNIQGILLEKHLRHHCLSGLHASYSLGGLGGSILGALFAAIGTTPLITFVLAALLLLCGWCMAAPHVLHSQPVIPHSTTEQTGRKQFSIPPFILICGILAMATFSVEVSCAEWSALLLHTVKGADESTAALGFGAFSITIAFCRLLGDELRQRWGDYALLLRSTVTALLGLCLVLLSPWPLLCLAGYALTGAGLAPIIPVLFSRAGARDDISPQRATTIIATLGYTGLLIIPPCIGWLAQRFGLETALLLPVGLTILLMASSPLFRKPV